MAGFGQSTYGKYKYGGWTGEIVAEASITFAGTGTAVRDVPVTAEATLVFDKTAPVPLSSPYAAWSLYATIAVTNPPAVDDYSVLLTVPYVANMNADFSDLRFTTTADSTLPYWIESKTDSATADVWIKLPAETSEFRIFCGNAAATSESDGESVFDFFDDFDGTTINAAKWTATPGTGGSIAVANSQVTITGNNSGSSVGWATLGGSRFFDRPCIIRIAAQFKGQTTYKGSLVALRTTVNKYVDLIWFNTDNKMRAENASYGDVNTNIDSNANVYELKYFDTGFAATKNGGSMTGSPITNASYIPTAAVNPQIHSTGGATYNIVVGFVAVRKYAATEPTCEIGEYISTIISSGEQVSGIAEYIGLAESILSLAASTDVNLHVPALATLAFSGTATKTGTYAKACAATIAFSGVTQTKHWIDFDALPDTSGIYPTGTIGVPVASASVRRGVGDGFWELTETIAGITTIPIDSLRAAKVLRQDHTGTTRCIFYGLIPGLSYNLAYQADQTNATGYDYGWYLTQQYVPADLRVMTAATNPADLVEDLLGGNAWETTTGIRPYRISSVTAWGTTLPAKEFVFEPRTTKWDAIQQLADYCSFTFHTAWIPVGSTPAIGHPDPALRILRVEAEAFDAGGEGVGYHDVDTTNIGGAYRTAEGVDIEYFATERGLNVGWIRDGEWLQYTRTFPWTGRYAVSARVAAATGAVSAYWDLYLDGVKQFTVYVGAQTVANGGYRTGSYQTFVDTDPDATTAGGVTIASAAQYIDVTAGEHVIKLVFGGNAENVTPSTKHQNIARFDLIPEGSGAVDPDQAYQPVAYWVADANIDSGTVGLDLPDPVTISDPAQYPADGVQILENASERYDSVTVRGHTDDGTYFEYSAMQATDEPKREKFEESARITDAASAKVYGDAMLAYYLLDQKSYRVTLPQRFDLQLYQLITFAGHPKLPTVACRIIGIEHNSNFQSDWTTIEIIPNTTWTNGRRLRRMLFPTGTNEIVTVIDHTLTNQPQPHIGTAATLDTSTGTFTLEEGGTMTARILD
jgi:hypothetical protein